MLYFPNVALYQAKPRADAIAEGPQSPLERVVASGKGTASPLGRAIEKIRDPRVNRYSPFRPSPTACAGK